MRVTLYALTAIHAFHMGVVNSSSGEQAVEVAVYWYSDETGYSSLPWLTGLWVIVVMPEVYGCISRAGKIPGIGCYCFPADPWRRVLWENSVARKDWQATRVCGLHFILGK